MKVLMAAGGTGGHVFPALSVANALKRQNHQVIFVGTEKGFEVKLVPQAGYPLELISVAGLKGKGILGTLKGIALLPRAFLSSWNLLSKHSPDAVFGIGGYASGPILLLAALRRMKTVILEPNSIAGFSNRMLGKFVGQVFIAFEGAARFFPKGKSRISGNPIRKDILDVPAPKFPREVCTILVFGGSQGARTINSAVIESLSIFKDMKRTFRFIHQTGEADEARVKEAYAATGVEAEVMSFIDDMAEAYSRSELVIARSGASVFEVAACGRPSILVPYPYAADDHQRENARVFESAGAAVCIEDQEFHADALVKAVENILENESSWTAMRDAALRFRSENAADDIAKCLSGGAS